MTFTQTAKHLLKDKTIPDSTCVIAVSKYQSIHNIKKLYQLGCRDFAESKAQDLEKKACILPKDIHWHFIGQIQTNKLPIINKYSTTIHSISRIKEIDILKKLDKTIDIFIQIKKDQSEQRSAALISELPQLLDACKNTHIKITGLMIMPLKAIKTTLSNISSGPNKRLIHYNGNILISQYLAWA